MKKLIRKETVIGACVLIALAILFFGIEYLKGVSIFKPSNYYYVVYENVNGLQVSAPVTVNGFKIGQVDNVELMYDNPGHVLVEISLDKKFQIPVNSKALISSDLLGTASIIIDMSKDTAYYAPGDTIPGSKSSGMMDKVTDQLLPGVTDILPKVDSILTNVNELTGNPALGSTLKNVEELTSALNSMTKSLNASAKAVPEVIGGVNSVVTSVDSLVADLNALSSKLATAPIDSTVANFNKISEDIAVLTSRLKDPDSTLGNLLNDSGLYDNLNNAAQSIDSLLIDIRKNPKRYINIKLL